MELTLAATQAATLAAHPSLVRAGTITLQALPERVNVLALTAAATVVCQAPADVQRPGTVQIPAEALLWAAAHDDDTHIDVGPTATTLTCGGRVLTCTHPPTEPAQLPSLPDTTVATAGLPAAAGRLHAAGMAAPCLLAIDDGQATLTATDDHLLVSVSVDIDGDTDPLTWPVPAAAVELVAHADDTTGIGVSDGQLVLVGDRRLAALPAHTAPLRPHLRQRAVQPASDVVTVLSAGALHAAAVEFDALADDHGMVPVRGTIAGGTVKLQVDDRGMRCRIPVALDQAPTHSDGPPLHFHVAHRLLSAAARALPGDQPVTVEVPTAIAPLRLSSADGHTIVLIAQTLPA